MKKLLYACHAAILVATEDTRWWLRPFQIILWWVWIAPKFPAFVAYCLTHDDDGGNQNYPGS